MRQLDIRNAPFILQFGEQTPIDPVESSHGSLFALRALEFFSLDRLVNTAPCHATRYGRMQRAISPILVTFHTLCGSRR